MNQTVQPGSRTGTVSIPASKSQAHRLLICAALGQAPVTIRCLGISKDIAATIGCLNALGAEWMDLNVTPKQGDLLQVNSKVTDLPAFNSETMTVILLCDRNATDLTREATLSYYVYGRYYETTLTLNP